MRRRIEELADALEEFVSEDAHAVLLLECASDAVPFVAAAIDLTEQRGSTDVHAIVLDALPEPSAPALAAALAEQARTLAAGLGLAPAPPDAGRASRDGLAATADALCALVDDARALGDVRVGLWICPPSIACDDDFAASAVRLASLVARAPQLRLALRATPALESALRAAGVVHRSIAFDASEQAQRDAMAEEASDPTTHPDRAAALALTVAMSDAAHGRTTEALSVITALAEHHHARGDAASRALCVVLAGNVTALEGDLAGARTLVARGLALATEARAIPVVLMGGMLAGELAIRAGDRDEADRRFDVVARVAAGVGAVPAAATALVARGKNFLAREEPARACDAWRCAAELARRGRAQAIEREALLLLRALYAEARMHERVGAVDVRLAVLPAVCTCGHDHEGV